MPKPTFNAFLSHRYKSPEVNKHFYGALSEHANVQFEVDSGVKATNVTRLEIAIGKADAFIGIWPWSAEADCESRPSRADALQASRYFRLELDIALRSRRPVMLFLDSRFGGSIAIPRSAHVYIFDHAEILGPPSDRRGAELHGVMERFSREVNKRIAAASASNQFISKDRVGLIIPSRNGFVSEYTNARLDLIINQLQSMSLQVVQLDYRASVDVHLAAELEALEWLIVDIGSEACSTGLPGYLHGYFKPQLRLLRASREIDRSPLESTLLASFEVGYPDDILRWRTSANLDSGLLRRLTTLYSPRQHFRTFADASAYFDGAAKRKEAVFLSYAGKDRDLVGQVADNLRKTFQLVFDYRDQGESIMPGRRWIDEIFDKLSESAIGIPLLSSAYLESGNCLHEARQMAALADQGKLRLIPVKLSEGELKLPAFMQDVQYLRGWEYPSATDLSRRIVSCMSGQLSARPGESKV